MGADYAERWQRRFSGAKSTVAVDYWLDVVLSLIKDKVGCEPKMVFASQSAGVAKALRGEAGE